ncbi:MAG TPA: NAD(P)-binding domain-containing protein [Glaciibacter sp.]|nr:NAD(P)-binding domain-containing protein [Glaciibacter sp.]
MTSNTRISTIAVLGAGHVGSAFARVAIEAGYRVLVAASGDPQKIELIADVLIPGAEPRWATDAIADADVVILAIPLHRFHAVDPVLLAGKIVVDLMNYWSPIDGVQPLFEDPALGSSEIVQRRLAESFVVKSFNHIGYHELESERRPAGSRGRQALGIAGDDEAAVSAVVDLVERFGYDALRIGGLRSGRILQPGGPVFGALLTAPDFARAIGYDAAA